MIRPLSIATLGRLNTSGTVVLPMATVGRLSITAVVAGGGGYYYTKYDRHYDKLEDIFKDMRAEDDDLITLTLWALKYLWRVLP